MPSFDASPKDTKDIERKTKGTRRSSDGEKPTKDVELVDLKNNNKNKNKQNKKTKQKQSTENNDDDDDDDEENKNENNENKKSDHLEVEKLDPSQAHQNTVVVNSVRANRNTLTRRYSEPTLHAPLSDLYGTDEALFSQPLPLALGIEHHVYYKKKKKEEAKKNAEIQRVKRLLGSAGVVAHEEAFTPPPEPPLLHVAH